MEEQVETFTMISDVEYEGWPFTLDTTNRFDNKIQTLWINPEGGTWMHRTHRTILGAKRFHTKALRIMTEWGKNRPMIEEEWKIRTQEERKLWGDENYIQ